MHTFTVLWAVPLVVVLARSSLTFAKEAASTTSCGNSLCDESENSKTCKKDCCSDIYPDLEKKCVKKGWEKITVNVDGLARKLLLKKPKGTWTSGAIIALHGGGGSHSNFCGDCQVPLFSWRSISLCLSVRAKGLPDPMDLHHEA
jgi:hypothetical protein